MREDYELLQIRDGKCANENHHALAMSKQREATITKDKNVAQSTPSLTAEELAECAEAQENELSALRAIYMVTP